MITCKPVSTLSSDELHKKANDIINEIIMVTQGACEKCGHKGKPRAGADFAGEMLCFHCGHTWEWAANNGYGHLP